MIHLGWKDFSKQIEKQIVEAFTDSLTVEKVFEKLRLLAVASKKTAAIETIKTGCFQYKTHYSATVDLVGVAELVVINLQ